MIQQQRIVYKNGKGTKPLTKQETELLSKNKEWVEWVKTELSE